MQLEVARNALHAQGNDTRSCPVAKIGRLTYWDEDVRGIVSNGCDARSSGCAECHRVIHPSSAAITGTFKQDTLRLAEHAVRLERFNNHLSCPSWIGVLIEVQDLHNVGSAQAGSTE